MYDKQFFYILLSVDLNTFGVQTYFSLLSRVENGVSSIVSSDIGNSDHLPKKYLDLDFKYP